jgi:hypothetical protein
LAIKTIGMVWVAALTTYGAGSPCSDHQNLTAHQISGQRRQAIIVTLRPTIFDANVLAIYEPHYCKALVERV